MTSSVRDVYYNGSQEMINMLQIKENQLSVEKKAVKILEKHHERSNKSSNEKLRSHPKEKSGSMSMREILSEAMGELGYRISRAFKNLIGITRLEKYFDNKEKEQYQNAIQYIEAQLDRIIEERSLNGTLVTYPSNQKDNAVKAIKELYLVPGLIAIDAYDIYKCIRNAKKSAIGVSEIFTGEDRAGNAARSVIAKLEGHFNKSIISDVIFNVGGDEGTALYEVNDAAEEIYKIIDDQANIIFGATIDQSQNGVRVVMLLSEREG